jgi:hypothetical protein
LEDYLMARFANINDLLINPEMVLYIKNNPQSGTCEIYFANSEKPLLVPGTAQNIAIALQNPK